MCENHALQSADAAPRTDRRRKLWDLHGLECSIVGTCFSHGDLSAISRKLGLLFPTDVHDYDVHAYFVQHVGKDGPISRAMQKLLERRYEGIVRKVGATKGYVVLEALWRREYDAGRIAGAYWAFMSHSHVGESLGRRIFGDVHMLSHVLGRTTHATASRASEAEARIDQLTAHVERQALRHREALAARDAQIAKLSASMADRNSAPTQAASAASSPRRTGHLEAHLALQKRDRALVAARERARNAEAEILNLKEQVARLKLLLDQSQRQNPASCPGAVACDAIVQSDIARRVLYIGGRTGGVDHLRRVASRARAELIHHDGGEEHALGRIEGLVASCDVVFCPVDCVSHSACLKAKALCKKLQKPFVPLRSSGATSFERALSGLTSTVSIAI